MAEKLFLDSVVKALQALEAKDYRKALYAVEKTRNSFDIDYDCNMEVLCASARLGEIACEALSMLGQHEEAIAQGFGCVDVHPHRYEGPLTLARALQRARRLEDARVWAGRAYQLNPKSTTVNITMKAIETDIKIEQANRLMGGSGNASGSFSSPAGNSGSVQRASTPIEPIQRTAPKSPRVGSSHSLLGMGTAASSSSPTAIAAASVGGASIATPSVPPLQLSNANVLSPNSSSSGFISAAAAVTPIQRTTPRMPATKASVEAVEAVSRAMAEDRARQARAESDAFQQQQQQSQKTAPAVASSLTAQPLSSSDVVSSMMGSFAVVGISFAIVSALYHCLDLHNTAANANASPSSAANTPTMGMGRQVPTFASGKGDNGELNALLPIAALVASAVECLVAYFKVPLEVYTASFMACAAVVGLQLMQRAWQGYALMRAMEQEALDAAKIKAALDALAQREAEDADRAVAAARAAMNPSGAGKVSVKRPTTPRG